jgi:YHS domain-containing protein
VISLLGLCLAVTLFGLVACSGEKEAGSDAEPAEMAQQSDSPATSAMYQPWNKVCPVAGHEVDPEVKTVSYEGKDYGFCCEGCDTKFQKEPAKYVKNLSKDGKEFIKKEG